MNFTDSAASSAPQEPTSYLAPTPTKNTVGTVAFVLAIVLIIVESGFNMTVTTVVNNLPVEQVQTFFFARAFIGLFLAFVVVVLATVSLVLKGRRKVLGAIALGAGGYAIVMALFAFIGNAAAAALL